MKKKLIALLLCTCITVSLFAALGTTAYADEAAKTIEHKVVSGDNFWNLCIQYKLTFGVCKEAIMSLNGYKNDNQMNALTVDKTVLLPASDEAAKEIAGKKSEDTPAVKPEEKKEDKPAEKKDEPANSGTVCSYVVSHTMESGETVLGIYSSWGLNYSDYEKQILSMNGLKNFNSMYAGRAYLFPVPSIPAGHTAAYSVISHKVASGEVAYNICESYKINYNNNLNIIKGLNGGSDLRSIYAGQTIYLPAPGNGGKPVDPGKDPTSKTSHNINLLSTTNGGFIAAVGSSPATAVLPGTKVTILASPNAGHSVGAISVVKADDPKTAVTVTSNSFVMPEYDVNISVSFK